MANKLKIGYDAEGLITDKFYLTSQIAAYAAPFVVFKISTYPALDQ